MKTIKISEMIPRGHFEKEKEKTSEIRKQISLEELLSTISDLSKNNEVLNASFFGMVVHYFEYEEEFTTEKLMMRISQDWLPFAWMLGGVLFSLDEMGKQALEEMKNDLKVKE